jgi:hypothetical protein
MIHTVMKGLSGMKSREMLRPVSQIKQVLNQLRSYLPSDEEFIRSYLELRRTSSRGHAVSLYLIHSVNLAFYAALKEGVLVFIWKKSIKSVKR